MECFTDEDKFVLRVCHSPPQKGQIFLCHFNPSFQHWSFNCVHLCVFCVLCWWSLRPWRVHSVYPAPCCLSNTLLLGFFLSEQVIKSKVSLTLFFFSSFSHCYNWFAFSLSHCNTLLLTLADCFGWTLGLVAEQPNKSVIHFRAVSSVAAAKQSTALAFMARTFKKTWFPVFTLFDLIIICLFCFVSEQ